MSDAVRVAATMARERLAAGVFRPKYVLMHGDLWKGNILLQAGRNASHTDVQRSRFAIIDWAGFEGCGYAIYDLVRLARSMRISRRRLAGELVRHCAILECTTEDARSYLLTALGHIGMTLEHFPVERYVSMSLSALSLLDEALKLLEYERSCRVPT
jgi:hypothetical protein